MKKARTCGDNGACCTKARILSGVPEESPPQRPGRVIPTTGFSVGFLLAGLVDGLLGVACRKAFQPCSCLHGANRSGMRLPEIPETLTARPPPMPLPVDGLATLGHP